MNLLLKNGMRFNLRTGQVYLTQNGTENTGEGSSDQEGEAQNLEDANAQSPEDGSEGTGIDESGNGTDGAGMEGMMPDMNGMEGGMGAEAPKDPLLANWFFVGGVSAGTFLVSVILGLLLARRRIKKGIELYED